MGILVHEICAGVAPYTSHREAGEGRQLEIYEQIISSAQTWSWWTFTRLLSRYEENRRLQTGGGGVCPGVLLVQES